MILQDPYESWTWNTEGGEVSRRTTGGEASRDADGEGEDKVCRKSGKKRGSGNMRKGKMDV